MYRPSIVTWPFYPSGSYLGVVLHSITPDDNFAESSDRFPMTITTKTCCGNYCSRQYHYRSDLPDGMPFLIEMREFLVECCCKKKECCTESTPDTNTMHFHQLLCNASIIRSTRVQRKCASQWRWVSAHPRFIQDSLCGYFCSWHIDESDFCEVCL